MRGRLKGSENGIQNKIKRICKFCKNVFYVWPYKIKDNIGIYCSNKCRLKKGIKVKQTCIFCKKEFLIYPYLIRTRKYCSIQCVGKFRIGKKLPLQWRKNMIKGRRPFTNSNGYIYIYQPNHPFVNNMGYVFEHRRVMEKKLGRYLSPEERMHHINGIKTDNRIENLMLFPNESKHQKYHNKYLR